MNPTAGLGRPLKSFLSRQWPYLWGSTCVLPGVLIALMPWSDGKEKAVCDQQISTLLNSHDPVELQRAQYIIRDLNCDVAGRLR